MASIIFVAFLRLMHPMAIAEPQEQNRSACENRKGPVILVELPDIEKARKTRS